MFEAQLASICTCSRSVDANHQGQMGAENPYPRFEIHPPPSVSFCFGFNWKIGGSCVWSPTGTCLFDFSVIEASCSSVPAGRVELGLDVHFER